MIRAIHPQTLPVDLCPACGLRADRTRVVEDDTLHVVTGSCSRASHGSIRFRRQLDPDAWGWCHPAHYEADGWRALRTPRLVRA